MSRHDTYEGGKLKRSHVRHFLDATFGLTLADASWFALGKDMDDMSMNLNAQTTTVKNVLDETEVTHDGYEPSMDIGTQYANPEDPMYPQIKDIAMNRKTGDDCKTLLLEMLIDKTTEPYDAWVEEAMIIVNSYGGSQSGVNIPYTIQPCGNRIKGTITLADGVPTFTAATSGNG